MEQFFRIIGKFFFPVVTIFIGLFLLFSGARQSMFYLLSAATVLVIGVLSLLFILDLVGKKILGVFSIVFLIGALFFGFSNVKSVKTTMDRIEKEKLVKSQAIQRLKDLRTAQLAYLDINGKFAGDAATLVDFVKNGKIPVIKKIGAIPDSIGTEEMARKAGLIVKMPAGMSDSEILEKGLIVRDTILADVLPTLYTNEKALSKRQHELEIDKMVYVPESGDRWEIKTGTASFGGVEKPYLLMKDPSEAPFYGKPALAVGSIDENHTNGNWKEK